MKALEPRGYLFCRCCARRGMTRAAVLRGSHRHCAHLGWPAAWATKAAPTSAFYEQLATLPGYAGLCAAHGLPSLYR